MKLRCVLIRHRWRQRSNEDGERYEVCDRCGRHNQPPATGVRNVSAL